MLHLAGVVGLWSDSSAFFCNNIAASVAIASPCALFPGTNAARRMALTTL